MFNWWRILALAVGIAAGIAATASASPIGDPYTISGTNLPTDFGPVTLTFDGIEEPAGAALINESVSTFAGIPGGILTKQGTTSGLKVNVPLLSFEHPGDLVEFSIRSASGGSMSDDQYFPWSVTLDGLQWPDKAGLAARVRANGTFLYVGKNGAPLAFNNDQVLNLRAQVGPHPVDPTVPQVVFLPNPERVFANGIAQASLDEATTEQLPFALLEAMLKVAPINQVHYAALVDFLIPGDANGDGYVDGADYVSWADHFDSGKGPGGKTWSQGDFTGDGFVSAADYTIWADHFHQGAPHAVLHAVLVPEPPSGGHLVVALLVVVPWLLTIDARRRWTAARKNGALEKEQSGSRHTTRPRCSTSTRATSAVPLVRRA